MARAKKTSKTESRTFEGTKKGEPFTVKTCLSNSAAVDKLRATKRDFAITCADHIELMGLGETSKVRVKYKPNLVAWGFRLLEDDANRVTLTLPEKLRNRVACRRPLSFVAGGEFAVTIRQCGERSKHCGKYLITDGTGFGGAFYGYAAPDGEWSPTRSTPDAVVEAIKDMR